MPEDATARKRKPPNGVVAPSRRTARAFIGISGYDYKGWRGRFYPEDLPARRWLEYASRRFNSIELNGTFYSLKSPATFHRWLSSIPEGFVFAIKGSRFITHNLKLRNAETALGNFFASGVLALGEATGPFLWQLPPTYRFDAERVDAFLQLLPQSSRDAVTIASLHDERVGDALVETATNVPWRHAFEVRHPTWFHEEFYDLLRRYRAAFVIADTAGKFPYAEEVTADFVYLRLHGSTELYVSGYRDEELDAWAKKINAWLEPARDRSGLDVFAYFDNDARGHAPFDALGLSERVRNA
jgi:uncharacterized protein YecE (DUF72 family)